MKIETRYCQSCRRTYDADLPLCPLDGGPLKHVPSDLPKPYMVLQDRYLVLEQLASGGMGAVFRAYDMRARCDIALKVLKPSLASKENAVRRFFAEARAARKLNHPNIISIRDFGVSREGFLFLAMEMLTGTTLADVLRRRGRLGVAEALMVSLAVCEALIHAHDNGVVHRDLKPENIFLVRWKKDGLFVKVVDFGVAALNEAEVRSLSRSNEVLGTPCYMSPEQVRGEVVDRRSDLYSLGIVIFEMLAGVPPFVGSTPVETMRLHLTKPLPSLPPLAVSGNVRRSLEKLLSSLLQKKSEDRPTDAREARAMIRAVLDNLSVENATTVDTSLFQEIFRSFSGITPFHERPTVVLDPGALHFHDQETLVLGDQRGPDGAMTLSSAGSKEQGFIFRPHIPWTIECERLAHKKNGEGTVTLSLLHAELDLGCQMLGPDSKHNIFWPELEAFLAEVIATGGRLITALRNGHLEEATAEIRIVFGLGESQESCAELAVRAAENLATRIERFCQATAHEIGVRVGVATDNVPERLALLCSSDVALRGSRVDLAVRLARMALPRQIVLDETTRQGLLGSRKLLEIGRIMVRGQQRPGRIFALNVKPSTQTQG